MMKRESNNEVLRRLIMSAMRKASGPVNADWIVNEVTKLGVKYGEVIHFKVRTNLGVLRNEGKIRKASFPTGRQVTYPEKSVPETKTFWYLGTLTPDDVDKAKKYFRDHQAKDYYDGPNFQPIAVEVRRAQRGVDRQSVG